MITNYSELQTAVGSWLRRTTLTNEIKEFIELADSEIRDRVKVRGDEDTETATVSGRRLQLPARFGEMKRLQLNTDPITKLTPVSAITNRYYQSTSGKPLFFSVIGNEIEFNRTPDSAYTVEMWFWQRVQALSDSVTTNNILSSWPNIYLYASLKHGENYLKNMERSDYWEGKLEKAIFEANKADKKKRFVGPLSASASIG